MSTMRLSALLLALPALFHCDTSASEVPLQRGGPFPATWSALEDELGERSVAFSPRYPLWTDGLAKARTVTPPPDTAPYSAELVVDPSAIPVGTVFTKTFATPDGEPVETRVFVARQEDTAKADAWEVATYLWDGDDARLLDGKAPVPVPGTSHVVPSHRQCATCHASAPSFVLGYGSVQLGLEPLLPDAPQVTREAVGWALGNCVHCHNGGSGPSSVYDLRPSVFAANTVCRETTGSMSAPGLRIVPGSPELSVLYRAIERGAHEGVAPMPPLGVTIPDPSGLAVIERFILALDDCPAPIQGSALR